MAHNWSELDAQTATLVDDVLEFIGDDVLEFIGDAALAIFPVRDLAEVHAACAAALDATAAIAVAIKTHNRSQPDQPDLDFGAGLHLGEVCYGNIGATERLDFTVIGREVNLASRLETLSSTLAERVVASEVFACRRVPRSA